MEQNANLKRALKLVGEKYIKEARAQLRKDGQYASGALAKSLDYTVLDDAIDIVSSKAYVTSVDEGSSPSRQGFGKVSNEFVDSILDWAMDKSTYPKKGPATEGNMRKMAYAIGRTIQRDGIIQQYGNTGSKVFDRVYNRLEKTIGEDLTKAYLEDLKTKLEKIDNNG